MPLPTPRNWPLSAITDHDRGNIKTRFIEKSRANKASLERLSSSDFVEEAICRYLRALNAPLKAVAAPLLSGQNWQTLDVAYGSAGEPDMAGLSTPAFGIAETGTIAFFSQPGSPTLLNFAPEIAIAILNESRIVGSFEEIWDTLDPAAMPRAINLVSGPSRTGDIEQTMYLGAHGPKYLHILLIEG